MRSAALRSAALGGVEHDGRAGVSQIHKAEAVRGKHERQREQRGGAQRLGVGAGKDGSEDAVHIQNSFDDGQTAG